MRTPFANAGFANVDAFKSVDYAYSNGKPFFGSMSIERMAATEANLPERARSKWSTSGVRGRHSSDRRLSCHGPAGHMHIPSRSSIEEVLCQFRAVVEESLLRLRIPQQTGCGNVAGFGQLRFDALASLAFMQLLCH